MDAGTAARELVYTRIGVDGRVEGPSTRTALASGTTATRLINIETRMTEIRSRLLPHIGWLSETSEWHNDRAAEAAHRRDTLLARVTPSANVATLAAIYDELALNIDSLKVQIGVLGTKRQQLIESHDGGFESEEMREFLDLGLEHKDIITALAMANSV